MQRRALSPRLIVYSCTGRAGSLRPRAPCRFFSPSRTRAKESCGTAFPSNYHYPYQAP